MSDNTPRTAVDEFGIRRIETLYPNPRGAVWLCAAGPAVMIMPHPLALSAGILAMLAAAFVTYRSLGSSCETTARTSRIVPSHGPLGWVLTALMVALGIYLCVARARDAFGTAAWVADAGLFIVVGLLGEHGRRRSLAARQDPNAADHGELAP
jgi:uncharacterized membrane protein